MVRVPSATAAIEPAPWREVLVERIGVARAGRDIEGVHGMRVACARLDVFLRLLGWRVLRDDLRWMRRAASNVRDLDVLLELDLPSAFREHLVAQRAPARAALEALLEQERCAALLEGLECLPAAPLERAYEACSRLRGRLAERGAALDAGRASVDDLHSLRRALRRLRYAHEWLGREPKAARKLQDELGALNDAVVALRRLDAAAGVDVPAEYRARLETEATQRAHASVEAWLTARDSILEERA